MKRLRILTIMAMALLFGAGANAQCTMQNNAYGDGEELQYKLYFNWQFVWVSAGTAQMTTKKATYEGKPAFRTSLITATSKKVDKYFVLRDTLLSYSNDRCQPLYYRKAAHEGKRYYVDEVWYSYPQADRTRLKQHVQKASGEHKWKENTYRECFSDMMSIFMKARNMSPEGWKKGHMERLPICDGDDVKVAHLRYNGTSSVKGEDGVKYKCLDLSYLEQEDGRSKEICRFFVTDDKHHIPVRIDLFLKFGTAKAFIKSIKR